MNLKDGGLILGKGVQTIESIAIENVKKIYIPKSVKQIDSDFFSAFEICVYEGTKAEFCNINRYDIFTGKSTSIKETLQEHPKYFDNYPLYINAKDISDTSHSWTN